MVIDDDKFTIGIIVLALSCFFIGIITNGITEALIKHKICRVINTTLTGYDQCITRDLDKDIIPNLKLESEK